MRNTTRFRQQLQSGKTLWVPGAYDVLSARLVQEAGFPAVLMSGFGIAASLLGQPDTELYTMTENLGVLRNVTQVLDIPVMADGDTGYGNAINVMRTVREFEAAGVASITFEDQVAPKKCPAVSDQTSIIPIEEGVAKIRAAVRARRDPDLVIIARTDARDPEEAIRRAKAYVAAGADAIKPIMKCFSDFEGLQRLRRECGVPLSISVLGWIERDLTPAQIESLGGIATYPLAPLLTATAALRANLKAIAESRSSRQLPITPTSEHEFKRFIGFEEVERLEREFLAG
jgi:2-methylisocitrate lyase-like PEP mutase family enzyme